MRMAPRRLGVDRPSPQVAEMPATTARAKKICAACQEIKGLLYSAAEPQRKKSWDLDTSLKRQRREYSPSLALQACKRDLATSLKRQRRERSPSLALQACENRQSHFIVRLLCANFTRLAVKLGPSDRPYRHRNSRSASEKHSVPQIPNTRAGYARASHPAPSFMTARRPLFRAVRGRTWITG